MFSELRDDSWVITIIKWGLGIAGWIVLRAIGRYDRLGQKVERLGTDAPITKAAIHRLEDKSRLGRTTWSEPDS